MTIWHEKYGLVSVRAGLNDDPIFRITPEIAIAVRKLASMAPWERACAEAAAWGLTADRAVVSGKAAARLQGLAVVDSCGPVDLTLINSNPRGPNDWPSGVHYRRAKLRDEQVVEFHGLRITRKARTVADVTRWYGLRDGVIALDSLRRQHSEIRLSDLRGGLLGPTVFAGRPVVRQALELSRPDIDSPLESWARFELVEADLGVSIKTQVRIGKYRVDLLIDDVVILEVDGQVKYDGETYGKSTSSVIREERAREKWLRNRGYEVIRVGITELKRADAGEAEVVMLVREALNRARRRHIG